MIARSAIRIFHTHVTGLGDRNRDGTDRHAIAERCQPGERLVLARESGPPADPISVLRLSGEQLGHLPRRRLRRMASRMARGWRYAAVVTDLTGGTPLKPGRGVHIAVFVGKPGVSDEVWEAALQTEVAPARRFSLLWVVLAAVAAVVIVWLAAR